MKLAVITDSSADFAEKYKTYENLFVLDIPISIDGVDYDLQKISHLSEAFCLAQNVQELMQAMKEHEQIMSRILNTKTVQELHFADFDGAVKSMGAWGGDFVMVASDNEPNKVKEYFLNKGFVTILGYSNVL